MKKVAVITGSRADYGLLYWTLREIKNSQSLELKLIVTGMHLSPLYGRTWETIVEDGFDEFEKVDMLVASDEPVAISKSIGLGVIGMSQTLDTIKPDVLLLLGDRFEMLAGAIAAVPFSIPIAHIHGGESTGGIIDEQIRHAITKISHIHFTSTDIYAERIKLMGENPKYVFTVGALGVEYIHRLTLLTKAELQKQIGIDLNNPTFLVTFHPETLKVGLNRVYIENILSALSKVNINNKQIIFTYPNADTDNFGIIDSILHYCENHKNSYIFKNLGQRVYLSLLQYVKVMIGNSSSGIIEAPSFKLPVVNIGDRQNGRIKCENVIDTGYSEPEIFAAIQKALFDEEYLNETKNCINIYDGGMSSKKIVKVLETLDIDYHILNKSFHYFDKINTKGAEKTG